MSEERDLNQIEARLRDAIGARTGRDDPMTDDRSSLDAIEERVAAERRSLRNRRLGLSVVGIAAAAAVVVGFVAFVNNDDGEKVATNTTTTTTTTEPGATTSTTTAAPVAAPVQAVWPFEANGVTFGTPYDAALSFAEDYLGMADPVALDPQPGDYGSTVEVRPRPTAGLITHVEVIEQDGGWVVLGSQADSIKVDTPVAGDALAGPMRVAGQSTAFEATINLHFRPFGSVDRVGEDNFTMGGASGEMGPFDTTIEVPGGLTEGVLVVYEADASGEGAVTAATVIRLGVPARGETAAPAPDQMYALNADGLVLELDGQGQQRREFAQLMAHMDSRLAVGGGVIATSQFDESETGGTCDHSVTAGSTRVPGHSPAVANSGKLAYVNCDTEVVANGAAYDTTPNTVVGLSWVGDKVIAAYDTAFTVLTQQGSWNGTLPTGRGRYGTIAFLNSDGTIASVDPATPSRAPVPLVTPAAKPVSLDADDSGAHLLWVDENGDLWKWSGGDPMKLGSGFTSAAW